jgi:hypothetical protein
MSEPIFNPSQLSVEPRINNLLSEAQASLRQSYQACEKHVRESPTTSVLGAVLAGYCLHRLPMRAILTANVRVLSSLIPPALFLFGAAKACELLQRPECSRRANSP